MDKERTAEVFIFEDSFFFTTKTKLKRVEGEKIALAITPLLKRFAVIGKRVHLKYETFALPAKVIGKGDEELILSLPILNPERPVGDRKSARVRPSEIHPIKLSIVMDGDKKEYQADDISEGGFSILVDDPEEMENFLDREVTAHIVFPVEVEEVKCPARMVNVQELPDGRIKLGFEMFIDDADMVKVRFYVYSRIREILRE